MKKTTTKIFSAVLAAVLPFSVCCAGTGVASAEAVAASHVLSIDIDSETFTDVNRMCCYIFDETDGVEVVKWGAKNGVLKKDEDTNVWRYDLDEHGVLLNPAHTYGVVFSDNWKAQTEQLAITDYDSESEYTAVFSEIFTMNSFSSLAVFKYQWFGENEGKAGTDVLSVRNDEDAFGADSNMLCRVYDETAEAYALWSGRMTLDVESDIMSFDFGRHGIELEPGHTYSVTFNDAEELKINSYDRSKNYTAEFTGAFITDEIGELHARLRWTDDVLYGDTNGDGKINIADATTVQMYLAEIISLQGDLLEAADANGDGDVDIADVTHIQMYVAQMTDRLG